MAGHTQRSDKIQQVITLIELAQHVGCFSRQSENDGHGSGFAIKISDGQRNALTFFHKHGE